MASLPILNTTGKETGTLELPEQVFTGRVNKALLHQAVVMYQACLRQGNASTKERGSVSGGGVKPWRQKGTGRARQGSIRSPLWSGGGVVFGPHPRDFRYSISKKMRRAALRESLNAKFQAKNLVCIDAVRGPIKKTKEFAGILTALKLRGRILALLDGFDQSVRLASRNIAHLEMLRTEDVTAYDILRNKTLLLTKDSFQKLIKRISDD